MDDIFTLVSQYARAIRGKKILPLSVARVLAQLAKSYGHLFKRSVFLLLPSIIRHTTTNPPARSWLGAKQAILGRTSSI